MLWAEEGPQPRCKVLRGLSQHRGSAGSVPAAGSWRFARYLEEKQLRAEAEGCYF